MMNRDKQIEEKRELKDILFWSGYGFDMGTCNDIAKQIQEQGYRKASDVAREIFEEIEELIYSKCFSVRANRDVTGLIIDGEMFAELKKKYTEETTEGEG